MKSALRLETKGRSIETESSLEVASFYIQKINAQLAKAGWGQDCVKYKSHNQRNDDFFVLCATAPIELSDWVNRLPHCESMVLKPGEVEFHLNIPIRKRPEGMISSETQNAVQGVIGD